MKPVTIPTEPQLIALIANSSMTSRLAVDVELPLERMRWVDPGGSVDVGDRVLTAVRPPLFDSPATRGLHDSRRVGCGAGWHAHSGGPMEARVSYPNVQSQVAFARLATALAFTSMGALAVGTVAVGRIAVKALAIREGRIGRLSIDELEVRRLHVQELVIDERSSSSGPDAVGIRA